MNFLFRSNYLERFSAGLRGVSVFVAYVIIALAAIILSRILLLRDFSSYIADKEVIINMTITAIAFAAINIILRTKIFSISIVFAFVIAIVFSLVNSMDIVIFNHFSKDAISLYAYQPELGSFFASAISYYHDYVPLKYILISFMLFIPMISIIFVRVDGKVGVIGLTSVLVLGLYFSGEANIRWAKATPRSELSKLIMSVPPNGERKYIKAVPRLNANKLSSGPRYEPKTIIVIINESTGYFFPDSEGYHLKDKESRPYLFNKIIEESNNVGDWIKYTNAITNSSASDVSIPSLLTGTGSYEDVEKLDTAPTIFDLAAIRGYETAFFTSSTLKWANFDKFFSSAHIDIQYTSKNASDAYVNDLGIDDSVMMRQAAKYISGADKNKNLFLVIYPYALHTPYQSSSETKIPDNLTDPKERALYILEHEHARLFETLHRTGRFDDSLIIETGDHGSVFDFDPRGWDIPRVEDYGEPVLRVPFLIKLPERMPQDLAGGLRSNADRLVQNLDIAPTIADLLGVGLPDPLRYAGSSLLNAVADDRIAIAVSVNSWRSWPRTSVALAKGSERFVCWMERLCKLSRVTDYRNPITQPIHDAEKYRAYLLRALSIPVVARNISFIFHAASYALETSQDAGVIPVPATALRSSLGPINTRPGGPLVREVKGETAGHIIYGPYWQLGAGQYTAEVAVDVGVEDKPVSQRACVLDVYDGNEIVALRDIGEGFSGTAAAQFSVGKGDTTKPYEIRLWCDGNVPVDVREVDFVREVQSKEAVK